MAPQEIQEVFTTPSSFILLGMCVFVMGMSKTGFPGINIVVTPVLIYLTNAYFALAIGIVNLYCSDIVAIVLYRKDVNKKIYFQFVLWLVGGGILSAVVGSMLSEKLLIETILIIVLGFAIFLITKEVISFKRKHIKEKDISSNKHKGIGYYIITVFLGLLSGISSTFANSSGPLVSTYLLMVRIPKREFIGTGAYLYFTINTLKIFIFIFSWKILTLQVFLFSLLLVPFGIAGAYFAKVVAGYIPEHFYRVLIIIIVVSSAVGMFLVL